MKEDLDQCLLKCKLDKNLKFCQKKSGEKCKTSAQIEAFMKTKLFYFISMKTIVAPEIYAAEA